MNDVLTHVEKGLVETAKLLVATHIEMGYEVIVVPPPSVSAVPARGREMTKQNLSGTSNPVSLL